MEETTNDEAKPIPLWNHHAIERGAEYGFSFKQVLEGWDRSVPEILSKKQQAYKFKKYGMRSLQSKYFWDAGHGILYTVHESKSGKWYVVTITKGKGNWSV